MSLLTAALAAGVCLGGAALAQQPDVFVKWAAAQAIPLRTVEADGDASDLPPLKAIVGPARVVALGEPTHGAHEPLAFRNRLIRFLVEQMGFTAVALETGFTESGLIERFIAGGPGDPGRVVRDGMTWGFGQYPENEELIRWLREYNANAAHPRKIHFYGIDLSGGNGSGFPDARRSVDAVLELLARADPDEVRGMRQRLDPLLDRFSSKGYADLSPVERGRLLAGLAELDVAVERNRSALIRLSSAEEYQRAVHNLVVARQLNHRFEISPPGTEIPPDEVRGYSARDSAMANNVRWALESEGAHGRLFVFAHNVHVMNSPVEGGIWSALQPPPSALGKLLRAALGRDLVIVGASAGTASGGLPPMEADPASLDAILARVAIPRFVVDLRPARDEPPVLALLSMRRPLHANLKTHFTMTPATAFDALFYVGTLTSAHAP
jgi:erythromycin esterase